MPGIGIKERFVVDEHGKKVGVFLDIEDYERLLGELEMLDDMRAYDEAKAENGKGRPFDEVRREIERERGWDTSA